MSIIFSFNFFLQAAANREGTEKDKEALTKIFEEFGFEVEPHDNLKANEIIKKMNQLAIRDYKNYGCVVVCMLSHGDEGTICGSDFYYDSEKKKNLMKYQSKTQKRNSTVMTVLRTSPKFGLFKLVREISCKKIYQLNNQ